MQWADFITYEGFRRIDSSLKGKDAVRKSLQAMLKKTNVIVQHFQEANFADMLRMLENVERGRPRYEGIQSGLIGCHGSVPHLPR